MKVLEKLTDEIMISHVDLAYINISNRIFLAFQLVIYKYIKIKK